MKHLGDMFSEEDKKKPHPIKATQGKDDQKYRSLMVKYKKMRRDPEKQEEAKKILKEALKLCKTGDVSDKMKLLIAYL